MTARRKPEHKRKSENVNIAMTKRQKEYLEKKAEAKGQYVSEYVRKELQLPT